jgi:hypothetical protein
MGVLTEDLLVKALSRQLNMPRAALGPTDPLHVPPQLLERVDRATCERLVVVPVGFVAERRAVQFAVADPANVVALDDLGRRLGVRIETLIAGETQIQQAIARLYAGDTAVDAGFGAGEALQLMDNSGAARTRPPSGTAVTVPPTPSLPPTPGPFAGGGFAGPQGTTGGFAVGFGPQGTGTFGSGGFAAPRGATGAFPTAAGFAGPQGTTGTFTAPITAAFAAAPGMTGVFASLPPSPSMSDEVRQLAEQQRRAVRALAELLLERGVLTAADLQARLR